MGVVGGVLVWVGVSSGWRERCPGAVGEKLGSG